MPFESGLASDFAIQNHSTFFIVPITIRLLIPISTISKVDDFILLPDSVISATEP